MESKDQKIWPLGLYEREIEVLGLREIGQQNELVGKVQFNLSDSDCLILTISVHRIITLEFTKGPLGGPKVVP